MCVSNTFGAHMSYRIRIDDLLPQGPTAEVWALWDVEDVGERRFAHNATIDRPQPTQNTEERGFSAPVGSNDKKMIARFKRERESFDQDVAIG